MMRDPICNIAVSEGTGITSQCDSKTFYFCSEGCRDEFLKDRSCKRPRAAYDLIIVGGGPAGLTSAVYAATMKLDAFLIATDLGGQAVDSAKIENYMDRDFITGPQLIENFEKQLVRSYYIDHIDHVISEVEKIEPAEDGFRITTSELKAYAANAVIITTGMTKRRMGVDGEERFQRKGVFYGNIQDLSFVQDKDVAVVGGGNSALQLVENLQGIARKIYLMSATKLTAEPTIIERISVYKNLFIFEEFKITALSGIDRLSGVKIRKIAWEETISLPVQCVFIAIGFQPNSYLVSHLVELNERGEIVIQPDCSTSLPGLFAAGDITNAFGKGIIIASGEGAKAALAARQYLLSLGKRKDTAAV